MMGSTVGRREDEFKLMEVSSPSGDGEALKRSRILIVDDIEVNVRVLVALLQHLGYVNVFGTTDPTCVLGLHAADPYDAFFIDVSMPVMDGFALTRALRALPTLIPVAIMVVTANAEENYREQALEAGADAFATKPLRLSEIGPKVAALLSERFDYVPRGHGRVGAA